VYKKKYKINVNRLVINDANSLMQMQVNPQLHATTEPQKRLACVWQGRRVYKKITKLVILYNIIGDCSIRLFCDLCGV